MKTTKAICINKNISYAEPIVIIPYNRGLLLVKPIMAVLGMHHKTLYINLNNRAIFINFVFLLHYE